MSGSQNKWRVLLIDDDPDDFAIVSDLLEEAGVVDVEWQSRPDRGLACLESSKFDAVLVDQRLGSMTGLDLIERAMATGPMPPLILLTGYNDPIVDHMAARAGASDYLVKDQITSEQLERSIRYAVGNHHALRALEDTQRELENQVESKNEFLATVSHELRNPLTALIGLAEVLGDMDSHLAGDERASLVATIVDSGFDLVNLVEDLLTAARQEAGQLAVVSVPVNPAAQAKQTIESLVLIDSVEVVGTAPTASADPSRVRQIIRNLVTNAVKYGGETVSVQLDEAGGMARVTVCDDGPGVPKDMERAIFDRYTRAHNDDDARSVGIGLAISAELAELMGGRLEYARRDGWTRFELSLPVAAPGMTPIRISDG